MTEDKMALELSLQPLLTENKEIKWQTRSISEKKIKINCSNKCVWNICQETEGCIRYSESWVRKMEKTNKFYRYQQVC